MQERAGALASEALAIIEEIGGHGTQHIDDDERQELQRLKSALGG